MTYCIYGFHTPSLVTKLLWTLKIANTFHFLLLFTQQCERIGNRCTNMGGRQTEGVRMRITKNLMQRIVKWRADGNKNSKTPNQVFFNRLWPRDENNSYSGLKPDSLHTERIFRMRFIHTELITWQLWTLLDCKQDVELREFGLRLKRYDSQIPQIPTKLKWSHLEWPSSFFLISLSVRQSRLRQA